MHTHKTPHKNTKLKTKLYEQKASKTKKKKKMEQINLKQKVY